VWHSGFLESFARASVIRAEATMESRLKLEREHWGAGAESRRTGAGPNPNKARFGSKSFSKIPTNERGIE
jgi:hypothetical protein